jgi:hypothetical protein
MPPPPMVKRHHLFHYVYKYEAKHKLPGQLYFMLLLGFTPGCESNGINCTGVEMQYKSLILIIRFRGSCLQIRGIIYQPYLSVLFHLRMPLLSSLWTLPSNNLLTTPLVLLLLSLADPNVLSKAPLVHLRWVQHCWLSSYCYFPENSLSKETRQDNQPFAAKHERQAWRRKGTHQ